MSARKLTEEQVREIYGSDKPARKLAKEYGVSRSTISMIWTGLRYQDVTNHDPAKPRLLARILPDNLRMAK